MGLRVEVHFSARCVEWLVPGVATALHGPDRPPKTLRGAVQQAVAQSAVLLACSQALAVLGRAAEGLIPACTGRGVDNTSHARRRPLGCRRQRLR